MERMSSALAVLGSHGTVASLVDAFLLHPKTLDGKPEWRPGNRTGERRLRWPVFLSGTSCGADLDLTAYPADHRQFMIGLSFPSHIWRVDFELPEWGPHVNPLDQIGRLGGSPVHGPHYHSWADNRYLATARTLPPELECARPMPANTRGFENVLRWFLGETNIALPAAQMIALPPRDTIL